MTSHIGVRPRFSQLTAFTITNPTAAPRDATTNVVGANPVIAPCLPKNFPAGQPPTTLPTIPSTMSPVRPTLDRPTSRSASYRNGTDHELREDSRCMRPDLSTKNEGDSFPSWVCWIVWEVTPPQKQPPWAVLPKGSKGTAWSRDVASRDGRLRSSWEFPLLNVPTTTPPRDGQLLSHPSGRLERAATLHLAWPACSVSYFSATDQVHQQSENPALSPQCWYPNRDCSRPGPSPTRHESD